MHLESLSLTIAGAVIDNIIHHLARLYSIEMASSIYKELGLMKVLIAISFENKIGGNGESFHYFQLIFELFKQKAL